MNCFVGSVGIVAAEEGIMGERHLNSQNEVTIDR